MSPLLCDSGVLIGLFDRGDRYHTRCTRLIAEWPDKLIIPEPVLGETCNFIRNQMRGGPVLEVTFLKKVLGSSGAFDMVDPTPEDRARAAELADRLVSGPLGYVDGIVLAMAERLGVPDIASVDFKFQGMAAPVSKIKPLRWVLQEL